MKNTPLKTSQDIIFIRPGPAHTVESKPVTAPAECVPQSLRDCHAAEQQAEIDEAQAKAKREAARAQALEIYDAYSVFLETKKNWETEIATAEGRLAIAKKHMQAAEDMFEHVAGSTSTALASGADGYREVYIRENWMAERLPKWIADRRAKLAKLDSEIAAFKQLHGIGIEK